MKGNLVPCRKHRLQLPADIIDGGIGLITLNLLKFRSLGEAYQPGAKRIESVNELCHRINHEFLQRSLSVAVDFVIQRKNALNHFGRSDGPALRKRSGKEAAQPLQLFTPPE